MLHLHAVFTVSDVVRGLVHVDANKKRNITGTQMIKTTHQQKLGYFVNVFVAMSKWKRANPHNGFRNSLLLFLRFQFITHHPSSVPSHTELW